MNRGRQLLTGILTGTGMILLIIDGKTACYGASQAMELCIKTVIPSLFPFFVLSTVWHSLLAGHSIRMLQPLLRFLGIPSGGESIFLLGFLGGYPTGAQAIAQSCQQGILQKSDGLRMLGFCSNAGPAFIFGILGPLFSSPWIPWILWAIHVSAALLAGTIFPKGPTKGITPIPADRISFPEALKKASSTMGMVCGWIILFRVILAFLDRWFLWLLPDAVQILFAGILELTNGCAGLRQIPDESLRFLLASAFLSFGGLCVFMQTASVTQEIGIGLYLPGKVFQTLFSITMAGLLIPPLFGVTWNGIWLPVLSGFGCIGVFLWNCGFSSRNFQRFDV